MQGNILIIGGGIAGLTAALALLRRGIAVDVFEEAPQFGEVGAGLSIQANARSVLADLDLIEALRPMVVASNGAARRHHLTGEILTFTAPGTATWLHGGLSVWFLHRADLHGALLEAIRRISPESLHLNARLAGLTQDEHGVKATFTNGATAYGKALVGADGLRSVTRDALFGRENPRFSGVVAWRGLVPMDQVHGSFVTPDSCRWIGPDARILCYPVRHRKLLNYVAAVGKQTWQVESWSIRSEIDELLGHFDGYDPVIQEVISRTHPDQCMKWALFDREPLKRWTVGRVTLLGDAAHAMLPFLGQGAGMGMEDGLVLARYVEAEPDIEVAFQRYEQHRMPRANRVQAESRANGRWPFDQQQPEPVVASIGGTVREHLDIETYDAATVPL